MSEALLEHLRDLFEPLGTMASRPMFGGYGIYLDGVIIGVVIDDGLYLKTDELTRAEFAAAGCEPCVYDLRGKPLPMSYWSVPAAAMDSPQAMQPWAQRALAAARRKADAPRSRGRKPQA